MKIVAEPKVYLVGRQTIDDAELNRFLKDEGVEGWETDTDIAAQVLVEVSGRLCYKSFARPRPGGNSAYIGHILEVGHGSVLEHAVFNLIITGVSRSLTHELIRHRAGMGYSQVSQRFVDEGDCSFVVPPELEAEVASARSHMNDCGSLEHPGACYAICDVDTPTRMGLLWLRQMKDAANEYAELSDYLADKLARAAWTRVGGSNDASSATIEKYLSGGAIAASEKTLRRKKAREAARSILPNATETQIFVTGNARALRHFLEMRGSVEADAEIRRLAVAVLRILMAEAPNLFGDYRIVPSGGVDAVATDHRKV